VVSLGHDGSVLRPQIVTTDAAGPELLAAVRLLLDEVFAGEFSDEDWEHTLGGVHAVVAEEGRPISHAAVVPRMLEVGGRPMRTGYVEGVATTIGRHGEGLGTLVMAGVMEELRAQFDLGALSTDRPGFYERLGWERWQGPTFVRGRGVIERTEDEDDGILVLRFGPSRDVDLGAPLVCEARSGDDW
jgi:aminoglycoside 2'-N-acetyltransferase I